MSNRKIARENGEPRYIGMTCPKCYGVERYTSNGACCDCVRDRYIPADLVRAQQRHASKLAREAARATGATRYTGAPCKRCNGVERLVANGGCIACQINASVAHKEAKRARYHSTTSHIVWVQEPPAPEYAALYAMCPTLAAYAGKWHAAYSTLDSDAYRKYTGRDVFAYPELLVCLANEASRGGTGEHHDIARHLMPAIREAVRMRNLSLKTRHKSQ